MAIYEYYCPTCNERFEQRRPMAEAAVAVKCQHGHKAERTLSLFAVARGGAGEDAGMASMAGGCCGGGACACGSAN